MKVQDVLVKVYEPGRLQRAWQQVRKNAGAAGIDQMTVEEFAQREDELLALIHDKLKSGSYRFQPARRVEIPKPGTSKKRKLGIPVVMDRIVGTSMHSVLEEIFDADFTASNFGFRAGRSQHQAIRQLQRLVREGRGWAVAVDLQAFLDRCSYYPPADLGSSKRSGMVSVGFIFSPLRLPWETWMASSSPRLTRCNTVWRDTPRMRMASTMGTYPAGASPAKRARSASVTRIRQGAPGVICSPAMSPSFRCRCNVDGATPSTSAASRMVRGSP